MLSHLVEESQSPGSCGATSLRPPLAGKAHVEPLGGRSSRVLALIRKSMSSKRTHSGPSFVASHSTFSFLEASILCRGSSRIAASATRFPACLFLVEFFACCVRYSWHHSFVVRSSVAKYWEQKDLGDPSLSLSLSLSLFLSFSLSLQSLSVCVSACVAKNTRVRRSGCRDDYVRAEMRHG